MRISVVVPALNEASAIVDTLSRLQTLRDRGHEIIVVDGGSDDETSVLAQPLADRVITSARGRARQMNEGAAAAEGDVLWFLHADTHAPLGAERALVSAVQTGAQWGRFDVRLSGHHPLLPVIAGMMNLRSRLTGIATGDQGMFVTRAAFDAAGGFPDIPLMEDIALSRALRRVAWPACLRMQLLTSGRRWETHGVWRTVLLMWRLRAAYWLGADPAELARRYR
ncbi:MAG: TIGR04283 family arsenosugar biosynthesis glycosyltransferase [Chromatiales bacterium]|jgi:rSAM/selenodomain-associated transferase 2|nr:TIGR04283 family arsenosugar biosynthesis glycosyltransferase [Chromatiales bacterium]MDX9767820.1 TIGR04283 family arsenosugar biosynthesis glycosyltransferase [Ectothiorhodospiraceae bacterium]